MERATNEHFDRISLRDEHIHRYELAARVAYGKVVDCACGVGYGSKIICECKKVVSYLGIDPSSEALQFANNNYSGVRIQFEKGTLEDNSCGNTSVDTFVMFETLEHTSEPKIAINNVRRVLNPNGLLIGSVPSEEYDALCEKVYGVNPYHIQRFSQDRLASLLKEYFEEVRLFSAEYILGTLCRSVDGTDNQQSEIVVHNETEQGVNGSILFLAGSLDSVEKATIALGASNKFFSSIPKAILDRDEVEPIRVAFHNAEQVLEKRWAIMQSMDNMIRERDEVIAGQKGVLEEHERMNDVSQSIIASSARAIGGKAFLDTLSDNISDALPFQDMAFSLYLFVERLFAIACADGAQDLFFLAEGGQSLKEMFDFYQTSHGGECCIRTHVLRVSYHATLLPSLNSIPKENFDKVFEQHRNISICDFLKDLDLDEHVQKLADELGVETNRFAEISVDLSVDDLFLRLVKSELFGKIYESERAARSDAFEQYFRDYLQESGLPEILYMVDLGWNSLIQTNISSWLHHRKGEKVKIKWYCMGLVDRESKTDTNQKMGLLFTNVHGLSAGFQIFNENRLLYELVLCTDNEVPCRYTIENDNTKIIEIKSQKENRIYTKISPIARSVISLYRKIVVANSMVRLSDSEFLALAEKKHSRMIFHPTQKELSWFIMVLPDYYSNQLFESSFELLNRDWRIFDRIQVSIKALRHRFPSNLGIWPWLFLRARALPGLSALYAFIRTIQCK